MYYDLVWDFFDQKGFQPHGFCLLWRPEVFWTHVVADAVIGLSYFAIPVALFCLGWRRRDLRYSPMLYLYAAFIVACGVTHFFGVWTMWVPSYAAEAIAKVVTAIVSAGVAVAMWPLLPKLVAIPSTAELEAKNAAFAAEIEDRQRTEQRASKLVEDLRRSNEELDTFAHAASHDLRAPLRTIRTAAEWIGEDLEPEHQEELRPTLDLMKGRIARMDRLLEDLLTHAKIGRTDQPVQLVNGSALMDGVLDLIEVPDGFAVEVDPAFSRATLPMMPTRNILLNLVWNAIKHHDGNQGLVRVGLRQEGELLEVSVEDDGPGIPPAYHDRVFEVFQTLRPRDQVEGSGLGLSMVKKAVELAGGTVSIESDGLRGTRFAFTLPPTGRGG